MNRMPKQRLAAACALLVPLAVQGGTLPLGEDWELRYSALLSYAAAMRLQAPAAELIGGPIDEATGLPTTINFDDGDRNFAKGALINNRVSALAEMYLDGPGYGAVLRGDAFHDWAYRGRNDNDSPDTVNKSGEHDRFSDAARRYGGGRARTLDAYVWADWSFGDAAYLNLRLGRQVVAWGESLFFAGLALAQGPVDATKANIPGVEVKNILLPVNQVAAQLDLTSALSLMGYYHFEYRATELEPVGAYFSTFDGVGPGAEFLYGFANPLAVLPVPLPGVEPVIRIPREADIQPGDGGQYGIGLKYALSEATDIGLYWLRYHNSFPQLQLNFGFPELAPGITTAPTPAPVSYQLRYFDGIRMGAMSLSTRLGPANVAGELSLRDGVDVLVDADGVPTATRARVGQASLSAIYLAPPSWLAPAIQLVGEVGYVQADDVEPVGGSRRLYNDERAWAFSLLGVLSYPNLLPQWDLEVPLTFAMLVDGRPPMAGAFGALYGDGDRRAGIATRFVYLQKFEVALSWNTFLGSPSLRDRPYADRDYAAINLKYRF